MKATDLTEAQIESARQFYNSVRKHSSQEMPADDELIIISLGDLARMVAWYGAIRFIAARDGSGGTLEQPEKLRITRRRTDAGTLHEINS